jgi:hypothetical protein
MRLGGQIANPSRVKRSPASFLRAAVLGHAVLGDLTNYGIRTMV